MTTSKNKSIPKLPTEELLELFELLDDQHPITVEIVRRARMMSNAITSLGEAEAARGRALVEIATIAEVVR